MVRLSLISKAYFVKEDEGTSIENISKREASSQICSAALILATTVSTLPWTHPCMQELKQVPFLGMLLPKMFTTLYPKVAPFSPHSLVSLHQLSPVFQWRRRVYGPPWLFDRLPGNVQSEKVSPTVQKSLTRTLPVSNHQASLQGQPPGFYCVS